MKMVAIFAAVPVALATFSCSSTTSVSCAQRVGTFVSTFAVQSGDCGDIAPQTETQAVQSKTPPPGCTGTRTTSADNCTGTIDESCALTGGANGGSTLHLKATVNWDAQSTKGTSAGAQVEILGALGRVICSGTYDVTIAKQ